MTAVLPEASAAAPGVVAVPSKSESTESLRNGCASSPASSVSDHYDSLSATSYDAFNVFLNLSREGEHLHRTLDGIASRMRLSTAVRENGEVILCDIGGGSGCYTHHLKSWVRSSVNVPWLVVDPFQSMIATVNAKPGLIPLCSSATDFADLCLRGENPPFSMCLVKEAVHHLDNRVHTFKGLFTALKRSGNPYATLLVFTRPAKIDIPLWPEALEQWVCNRVDAEVIAAELRESGFPEVQVDSEAIPCSVHLKDWENMVMRRCWSTFSAFSDEELKAGLEYVARRATETEPRKLFFEDTIVYLTARVYPTTTNSSSASSSC